MVSSSVPSTTTQGQGPLLIRIGNKWVNLEAWKRVHPGGDKSMERFRDKDATDQFFSLHSKEAIAQFEKMKSVAGPSNPQIENDTPVSKAFGVWRNRLNREGWFDRNWTMDALYIGIIVVLSIVGTYIAVDHPIIASVLIGLAMQQAGWLGHDYVHGRGTTSYYLGRAIGSLFNGFSSSWWSQKHNTHHVHTNQVGVDDDIANDPILHLYLPDAEKDVWYRPYQYIYYHLVYAFLFVSWRIQSIQYAYGTGNYKELFWISFNYIWLATLPLPVAIGSIIVGGWLVAEIVTASHQSEEMIEGLSYTFVEDQFNTTRDVHFSDPFSNWLWGGMQYQLIHHLFPTMPKYRFAAMVEEVDKFAKQNGLEYRRSNVMEILAMNYETMKRYSAVKN